MSILIVSSSAGNTGYSDGIIRNNKTSVPVPWNTITGSVSDIESYTSLTTNVTIQASTPTDYWKYDQLGFNAFPISIPAGNIITSASLKLTVNTNMHSVEYNSDSYISIIGSSYSASFNSFDKDTLWTSMITGPGKSFSELNQSGQSGQVTFNFNQHGIDYLNAHNGTGAILFILYKPHADGYKPTYIGNNNYFYMYYYSADAAYTQRPILELTYNTIGNIINTSCSINTSVSTTAQLDNSTKSVSCTMSSTISASAILEKTVEYIVVIESGSEGNTGYSDGIIRNNKLYSPVPWNTITGSVSDLESYTFSTLNITMQASTPGDYWKYLQLSFLSFPVEVSSSYNIVSASLNLNVSSNVNTVAFNSDSYIAVVGSSYSSSFNSFNSSSLWNSMIKGADNVFSLKSQETQSGAVKYDFNQAGIEYLNAHKNTGAILFLVYRPVAENYNATYIGDSKQFSIYYNSRDSVNPPYIKLITTEPQLNVLYTICSINSVVSTIADIVSTINVSENITSSFSTDSNLSNIIDTSVNISSSVSTNSDIHVILNVESNITNSLSTSAILIKNISTSTNINSVVSINSELSILAKVSSNMESSVFTTADIKSVSNISCNIDSSVNTQADIQKYLYPAISISSSIATSDVNMQLVSAIYANITSSFTTNADLLVKLNVSSNITSSVATTSDINLYKIAKSNITSSISLVDIELQNYASVSSNINTNILTTNINLQNYASVSCSINVSFSCIAEPRRVLVTAESISSVTVTISDLKVVKSVASNINSSFSTTSDVKRVVNLYAKDIVIPGRTYTTNGTYTTQFDLNDIKILVVAGGGAGGNNHGGGGGAGGLVLYTGTVTSGSHQIIVGSGGVNNITNGGSSSFDNIIAIGGGHGGSRDPDIPPSTGGSGGGGGGTTWFAGAPAAGTTGQGNKGGFGYNSNLASAGGGGGGYLTYGSDAYYNTAGGGGLGINISISGSNNLYCVGGEGGDKYAKGITSTAYGSGGGGGRGSFDPGVAGVNGVVIIDTYVKYSSFRTSINTVGHLNNIIKMSVNISSGISTSAKLSNKKNASVNINTSISTTAKMQNRSVVDVNITCSVSQTSKVSVVKYVSCDIATSFDCIGGIDTQRLHVFSNINVSFTTSDITLNKILFSNTNIYTKISTIGKINRLFLLTKMIDIDIVNTYIFNDILITNIQNDLKYIILENDVLNKQY